VTRRQNIVAAWRWVAAVGVANIACAQPATTPPPPRIALAQNLIVVINFPYLTRSPDLVLSLNHLGNDGLNWRADTKLSATDASLSKADYGSDDFENADDLKSAHHIFMRFFPDENVHAGGTVLHASSEVFDELTQAGATQIDVVDIPGEKGMVYNPGVTYQRKNFRGVLQKVGRESMRVLVNDEPVMLPVLHAKGQLKARDLVRTYEFWWLDDPTVRLLMHVKSEDYTEFRVVRVDEPDPDHGQPLGRNIEMALSGEGSGGGGGGDLTGKSSDSGGQLKKRPVLPPDDKDPKGPPEKTCHAPLHGVYFPTGSAEILEPSRPALATVAAMLKRHPDWQVQIEGHTDNVGGDDSNLLLSRNRAAAVKDALTSLYGISASRIRTEGYGRKRPVDTNDTPDGRAHNRRVEMTRRC
jgi:outer membrane protein OmpA-like peptidoglycan-associated protein